MENPEEIKKSSKHPGVTFIYVQKDKTTDEIRYVGKTDDPKRRLKGHNSQWKRTKTHKDRWIAQLRAQGLSPIMQIIEEVPFEKWEDRECYWIEYYRTIGCPLTNTSTG